MWAEILYDVRNSLIQKIHLLAIIRSPRRIMFYSQENSVSFYILLVLEYPIALEIGIIIIHIMTGKYPSNSPVHFLLTCSKKTL